MKAKRITAVILAAVMTAIQPLQAVAQYSVTAPMVTAHSMKAESSGWQQAYAEKLKGMITGGSSDNGKMFDIYDVDSDGVPELFVSNGSAHYEGGVVYTYSGGEVNALDLYISDYGTWYVYDDMILCPHTINGSSGSYDSVFRLVGGQAVLDSVQNWNDAVGTDGTPVNVGRKYDLNEENIKSVFSDGGSDDSPSYTWVVEPTIEAEDIIVVDYVDNTYKHSPFNECAYILKNDQYGIILYDGSYIVGPEYPDYKEYALSHGRMQVGSISIVGGDELTFGDNPDPAKGGSTEEYYYSETNKKLFWCFFPPMQNYEIYDHSNNPIESSIGKDYREILACQEAEMSYSGGNYSLKNGSVGTKWGAVDKSGTVIGDFIYDDVMVRDYYFAFSDNDAVAALKTGDKWCYIDSTGKKLTDFSINGVSLLSTGFGKDHSSEMYNAGSLYPFLPTEGFIAVNTDEGAGFIDTKGNTIIAPGTFAETRPVHSGKAWVKDKTTGLWGIIQINNDDIIEPIATFTDWQTAYKYQLHKLVSDGTIVPNTLENGPKFYLYDLNKDDSPELFVSMGDAQFPTYLVYSYSYMNKTLPEQKVSRVSGSFAYCRDQHILRATVINDDTALDQPSNLYYSYVNEGFAEVSEPDDAEFDVISAEKYYFDDQTIDYVIDNWGKPAVTTTTVVTTASTTTVATTTHDPGVIEPLEISFENVFYTKVSDQTYEITANVKNVDQATAKNVKFELLPSSLISISDEDAVKSVGDLGAGEETTETWTVTVDTSSSYATLCGFRAKADNSVKIEQYGKMEFNNRIPGRDNRLIMGKDTWDFLNTDINFNKGYYMTQEWKD
ncbi:MAG TPA: hypothetical protein DCZ62_03270, partial [Ruminococcus sp.]|nr:hypothetical protein [Ruminococcus sp.]